MFFILTLLSFFLSFTGCSSTLVVLKPNCSEMNWFEKGRQDGLQGQPSNNWIMYTKDCDKMQQAEIQNYLDGWNHGLSLFCTEKHGFIMAKTGTPYKKTCPDKYEADFLKGYQAGLEIFLIERETSEISTQIASMSDQLKRPEIAQVDKEKLLQEIESLSEKKIGNLKTLEKYNKTVTQ